MSVVIINRDDDLSLDFDWTDVDGNPLDLSGATIDIVDNDLCPDLIATITYAVLGMFTITQPYTSTRKMPHTAWFRVVVTTSVGHTKSTPRIEINVI